MATATKFFVHLPELGNDVIFNELVDKINGTPRPVAIVVNYHTLDPWHGPPPHLSDDGSLYTRDGRGLGYAPFGWTAGWNWARARLGDLLRETQPDYMQQGVRPDIRNGWGWATEPHYHYNDTMSIFKQAANDAEWDGTFVVAESPSAPQINTRGMRAARVTKPDGARGFTKVLSEHQMEYLQPGEPGDVPPPPDDDEPRVAMLINLLDLTPRQLNRFRKFLDSLE